jgi:phage-related protein
VSRITYYKDENDRVDLNEWLDELPKKVQDKCVARIKRLKEKGHELRRPEADYLRDGVYELRIRYRSVNYRMLYFFWGQREIVISHGLTKESAVPDNEIDRAVHRKKQFRENPEMYGFCPGSI